MQWADITETVELCIEYTVCNRISHELRYTLLDWKCEAFPSLKYSKCACCFALVFCTRTRASCVAGPVRPADPPTPAPHVLSGATLHCEDFFVCNARNQSLAGHK